jgi:hypothetical protein
MIECRLCGEKKPSDQMVAIWLARHVKTCPGMAGKTPQQVLQDAEKGEDPGKADE